MTVRVGIVGSGFMGRTWAEVAANHAAGTSLVAVTGGRRAPTLAADFGVPLEPSLEALLARWSLRRPQLSISPRRSGLRAQAGICSSRSRWPSPPRSARR
jgi:hypothetical protein